MINQGGGTIKKVQARRDEGNWRRLSTGRGGKGTKEYRGGGVKRKSRPSFGRGTGGARTGTFLGGKINKNRLDPGYFQRLKVG